MTDDELELRLRAWYRAEVGDRPIAPLALREQLAAIPSTYPLAAPRAGRRPGLTLLIAATLLLGGAIAAGAGLLRLSTVEPPVTPLPSQAALPSAPPAEPSRSAEPPTPPKDGPARPIGQEVLAATQGFLLARDGAGWAATATGIYRTLDGGTTWRDVRPVGWTVSTASALVDAQTAYVASDSMPMVIAATHSGGAAWTTATIQDDRIGFGPTLAFQTPLKGFAIFYDRQVDTRIWVFATTDGGQTWTGPRRGSIPRLPNRITKLDRPMGGILVLLQGTGNGQPSNDFVMSLDGGVTWLTRSYPISDVTPRDVQKWIAQIAVEGDGVLQMAIQAGNRGSVWRSGDRGVTWQLVRALPRGVDLQDADFISPTEWVFQVAEGSAFRSTVDAGAHWRTVRVKGVGSQPGLGLQAATFASVDVGWASMSCRTGRWTGAVPTGYCSGDDSETILEATTDGGRTWAPIARPVTPIVSPVLPGPAAWVSAGTMVAGRWHVRGPGLSAITLDDGRVLVVGGVGGEGADLYDPIGGMWTATGKLAHERSGQIAAPLPDGRVLVAGGSYDDRDRATTEIFDPASGRWSMGASMRRARENARAAVLQDGRILVVGGDVGVGGVAMTAEIYDPVTGRWSMTESPRRFRFGVTPLVTLADGRVLMAGGNDRHNQPTATAELYDPATGRWTGTGRMTRARADASALRLADGRVLVVGGAHSFGWRELPTAEIFDPATGRWSTATPMSEARTDRGVTLLSDGRVLVTGGSAPDRAFYPLATAEIYDPATDTWSPAPSMATARYGHAALTLADGSVLVVGGHSTGAFHRLGSAERFYPDGGPPG